MNDQREMIINGPGGAGKTFLMGHLIKRVLPHYREMCQMMGIPAEYVDVQMTATTNKAAEVLTHAIGMRAETIHSFLGLTVKENYATGETYLKRTDKWRIHQNLILFIDEDSVIDIKLLEAIRESTLNCKIVYVGDDCQALPIKGGISPVFTQGLPMFELTEQMRNAEQPALQAICTQLRTAVKTEALPTIQLIPGVIELFDQGQMFNEVDRVFRVGNPYQKILTFSNERAIACNDYIRELRGLPPAFVQGELLVNNAVITNGMAYLSVEQEIEILHQAPTTELVEIEGGVAFEVRRCQIQAGDAVYLLDIPVDRRHFTELVKYYQRIRNWTVYFKLKRTYPDLRQNDACTIHKSQGSTYDTVYVDLSDLSTSRQSTRAVSRLLYVAFSRARKRVVLYGELASKFGEIIQ